MKIFDIADAYNPIILKIQKNNQGEEYKYLFMQPDENAIRDGIASNSGSGTDILKDMRLCYTLGILERCHLSCILSLSRGERWLSGTMDAIKNSNFLAFSAALRGLLEAAADSHDILAYLPDSLRKSFRYLYLVVKKSADIDGLQVGFGPLEEKLIHFAYAKRHPYGVIPQPHHTNKSNAEYIRVLEAFSVPKLSELYSELCQYTHPAAPSIDIFIDEEPNRIFLNFEKDKEEIDSFLDKYSDVIEGLISYSFNPALLGMAILEKIIPEWLGPGDKVLAPIGNCKVILEKLDEFIGSYTAGSVTRKEILDDIRG